MIVIKIKTWKDWKKDFIDWVKGPRPLQPSERSATSSALNSTRSITTRLASASKWSWRGLLSSDNTTNNNTKTTHE